MQAIIMAGGFGTRIQPLTNSLPKPMIPVAGRPMMEHIVRQLRRTGITDIIMLLYYRPEVIQGHFGDGQEHGVRIRYVIPDDDYGTAGAVKCCQPYMDETFMVISGDLVTDFDLSAICRAHAASGEMVTITLTSVPNPLQFGVVVTDERQRIARFLEKPGWGEVFSDTINTGIYIFEPEVFDAIPAKANFDFSKDLFPLLMKRGTELHGYNARGFWRDVGNPDSYRECLQEFSRGEFTLDLGVEPRQTPSALVMADDSAQYDGAFLEGTVVLGPDVVIGDYAKLTNCILGRGCRIETGAELENCILWEDCSVGTESHLRDLVICSHSHLGRGVEATQGAIIAENVHIDDRVCIEKDITIWPDKHIEEDAIVSSNVIWGDKFKASIFEGGVITGLTNVQISVDFAARLGAAYASFLPRNSTIVMSRDYHKASRMIKRAFLGGILSAGVNVMDLQLTPVPITRYQLEKSDQLIGGVHFRQDTEDDKSTYIQFYDARGNVIDTAAEKAIERLFFREKFRKAAPDEVGDICQGQGNQEYMRDFVNHIDAKVIQTAKFKVVLDLSFGSTIHVFPEILRQLGVEIIALNAYENQSGLSRSPQMLEAALDDIGAIVRTTKADMGFLLMPNGARLRLVDDQGRQVPDHQSMLLCLQMLFDAARQRRTHASAYVPVSAPGVLDEPLAEYLSIQRGKFVGLQGTALETDMIAFYDGMFAFRDFSSAYDAMFAMARILELLAREQARVSQVLDRIPEYAFEHRHLECPMEFKGTLMRRMSEEAISLQANFTDGIKIFFDPGSLHMIPDQHEAAVHLFAEHPDAAGCGQIMERYERRIADWLTEAAGS